MKDLTLFTEITSEESAVYTGGTLQWVATQGVPKGAVPAGYEVFNGDTYNYYICRGNIGSNLVPGKLVGSSGVCYLPWYGQEISTTNYQVLVDI
jgi:hypothetical protein